jgi:hypothetical protein
MGLSAMTVECEVQKKDDVLHGLVESLGRLAVDSTASICNRFEAIDLLLRLAIGPRCRPADSCDFAVGRSARITLSDVASFLERIMTSNDYRARIRLHAASLGSLVMKVSGASAHAHSMLGGGCQELRGDLAQLKSGDPVRERKSLL